MHGSCSTGLYLWWLALHIWTIQDWRTSVIVTRVYKSKTSRHGNIKTVLLYHWFILWFIFFTLHNYLLKDVLQVCIMKQSDVELKQVKSLIKRNHFKTDEEMVQGFDIDTVVKLFDRFTRGKGNLLNSNLVRIFHKKSLCSIFYYLWKNNTNVYDLTPYIHWKQILLPYFKCSHYCLYVMNRCKKISSDNWLNELWEKGFAYIQLLPLWSYDNCKCWVHMKTLSSSHYILSHD